MDSSATATPALSGTEMETARHATPTTTVQPTVYLCMEGACATPDSRWFRARVCPRDPTASAATTST